MAFSSKRINAYDVAQMCGVEHDEAAFVLNGLYPIIVCEGDRYFAFHNDVRLFLQNAIIHNSNIKGITESIINRIKQDRELWKYRYDISFNLLVSCKATDEVLKLIDVEYVMDSALYGISFDRILQQFILAHQLPMDNLEEVCIHSSAVSLCLAQYANCIQYYAKESDYFEAQSINKKTKAEKYCLNVKNDIEQIILDIDFAAKAGFERGHKLFDEYLSGYNIEALLSGELNKETLVKAGYIFRCYGADYMDALTGNSNDYVYFVDGWLDASVSITSKEDIRQTFTFKWYNPDSLYAYIHQITEEKNLEKESFDELLNILLGMSASKLIMEAGDIIAQKHMEEYVNRCVVKFILSESKYGYIGSGISDVFERYYEMFNDNTWNLLFENIVTRFAESDYGIIASLWGDFTIFSIYYLSRIDKDKIKALFDCLCKTHESLSSANGRVKIKEEKLILDENITSLSDMVNFQLNI